MELIRRHSDYAIRALLYLACAEKDRTPCGELAQACAIPKSFAYKILGKLANAGLVSSRAGRPGGFRLCKTPNRISLHQVVEAVQGPISVAKCILDYCDYGQRSCCPLSAQWRKLQDDTVRFLKKTTLGKVLAASK